MVNVLKTSSIQMIEVQPLGSLIVRIIHFYYLFFHRIPTHKLCFFPCRPLVVNAIISTGLVGC